HGASGDNLLVETPAREMDGEPRIGPAQSGPPSEIGDAGRTVPGEVTARALGEGLFAREPLGAGQPLFEEHERVLLGLSRSETQKTLVRKAPQNVDAPRSVCGDLGALEGFVHHLAGYCLPAIEAFREHPACPSYR